MTGATSPRARPSREDRARSGGAPGPAARLIDGLEPRSAHDVVARLQRRLREGPVPGLVSMYLFGSHARDAAHRESDVDVDVAVLLDRGIYADPVARFDVRVRLATELGAALGRETDVVVLNDAPPLLARRIVDHGRRLLCDDEGSDRAFVLQVNIHAADLLPWYRRYARIKLDAIR